MNLYNVLQYYHSINPIIVANKRRGKSHTGFVTALFILLFRSYCFITHVGRGARHRRRCLTNPLRRFEYYATIPNPSVPSCCCIPAAGPQLSGEQRFPTFFYSHQFERFFFLLLINNKYTYFISLGITKRNKYKYIYVLIM